MSLDQDQIIKDIYLLFELSLKVGRTLDLQKSCNDFLSALQSRKGYYYSSVWLWEDQIVTGGNPNKLKLFYSNPHAAASLELKPEQINTLKNWLVDKQESFEIIDSDNPDFSKFDHEGFGLNGSWIINRLADVGVSKIFNVGEKKIEKSELFKLESVFEKFGVAMQACVSHRQALESESQITGIINSSLDGFIVIDEAGKVVRWNENAASIFGWTAEEAIGEVLSTLIIPEELREAHERGMKHYLATGEGPVLRKRIEVPGLKKNGEKIDCELTVIPIQLEHSRIFGAFVRDITDEKIAQKALVTARESAEISAQSRERFLANMSHEIRTPLNAINGMTELLRRTPVNAEQEEYLDAIGASISNLLVMINDILDLTKIEAGKIALEHIGFDLRKWLIRLLKPEKAKANEKGVDLQLQVDDSICKVLLGDPVRLCQILLNLTSNALKFTPSGTVCLKVEMLEDEGLTNELLFTVSDTGIGINKEKLENIFESFTQADESITRRFGGTGLGLAISKKLVNAFGAELEVDSQPGKGSTFSFRVVFEKGNEEDLQKSQREELKPGQLDGVHVLLVEDHEVNRFFLKRLLTDIGLKISTAENGKEAVDRVKLGGLDLVLMDMQMPVMDGLEATRIIRKDLQSKIPIIALTANVTAAHKRRCLEAGMDDYLPKPFETAALLRKISRLLPASEVKIEAVKETKKTEEKITDGNAEVRFDLSTLKEMAKGDEAFVAKMIQLFVDRTPPSILSIREHFDKDEREEIQRIAHKLKPSMDYLHIEPLTTDIRELESTAVSATHEELEELIAKVEASSAKVTEELKSLLPA